MTKAPPLLTEAVVLGFWAASAVKVGGYTLESIQAAWSPLDTGLTGSGNGNSPGAITGDLVGAGGNLLTGNIGGAASDANKAAAGIASGLTPQWLKNVNTTLGNGIKGAASAVGGFFGGLVP